MTIGEKNRQIDIYSPTMIFDAANEPTGDDPWILFKTKWAQIKGESGMGKIRGAEPNGGVVTPLNRYSFRINYDRSISTVMQVRDREGNRYGVVSVLHDAAGRQYTDIVCEIGGANG